MPFEILNRAFVFLRCIPAVERAEIFSFACSRIFLAGIQPILAGLQFPNHVKVISDLFTLVAVWLSFTTAATGWVERLVSC
jgi:hypothetical protein